MAVYKDINSSVRIGGSLTLPAGSITLSNKITLDNASGQITATKFSGDGSLLTNLSSANMAGVLLLDGTRSMSGNLILPINGTGYSYAIYLKDSGHLIRHQATGIDGATLDGIRVSGYSGVELTATGATALLAVFRSTSSKINTPLTISGNITATGYSITADTINAGSNLQEAGTNLSAKYAALSGANFTGVVTTSATHMDIVSGTGTVPYLSIGNGAATTPSLRLRSAGTEGWLYWNDTTDTFEFQNNASGFMPIKFSSATATGTVTATSYYVGATAIIDTNGKVDWSYLKSVPTTFAPSAHTHAYTDIVSVPTSSLLGRVTTGTGAAEALTVTQAQTLLNVADGATKTQSSATNGSIKINGTDTTVYTHPSGDGNLHVPATSTTNNTKVLKAGLTAGAISWAAVDWSELTSKPTTFAPSAHTHAYTDVVSVPTASILGRKSASTGATEVLAKADVLTLINVTDGATKTASSSINGSIKINDVDTTVYTHPSSDGNLHVPATSTTNNAKVLKAGSTAGSIAWGAVDWTEVTNKPTYDNYASWKLSANTEASPVSITSGSTVDFKAGSNVTISRSGNTITVNSSYTDTNTWRPIDDTPVNGSTTTSISSNWAYNHNAGTGNGKHVPAAGTSGQYLAYNGAWATPPDTNIHLSSVSGAASGTVTFTLNDSSTISWDASHTHNYDNYGSWKLSANTEASPVSITSGSTVDFKAGSNVTLSRSGNAITINSSYVDTNNYVTAISSTNGGNGTLTLSRSGLSDLTLNLFHNHDTSYLGISAKASDSDKLDGLDSTQFIRSDVDSEVSANLLLRSIGNDNNGTYLPFVDGGGYVCSTPSVAGAIKITLPQGWTNTMMRFAVDIYEYVGNKSMTVFIGGYNYSNNSSWANSPFAYTIGGASTRNPTVRFGYDGTKCVIYIGELTDAWSYPQVRIRDFFAGYSNYSANTWNDGWNIGFESTAFASVTATISNTLTKASDALTLSSMSPSTSANASTIVQRDSSGGFANKTIDLSPAINTPAIRLRNGTAYDDAIAHDTNGVEAMAFMEKNSSSTFKFKVGFDPATFASGSFVAMTNADLEIGNGYAKINGNGVWHAGNFTPANKLDIVTPYIGIDITGNAQYPRMVLKNSAGTDTSGWIRVADNSSGIIPYSNGNSYIGTSTWKFGSIYGTAIYGDTVYEGGTALASKYLGISAKAADSDKLDGLDSTAFARTASSDNSVYSKDTRGTEYAPQDRMAGLYMDFKQNSTNSLSDGGTYNGVLTFRPYGTTLTDFTGGPAYQLGFTAGGNMWYRMSSSATAWGTWYKFYHSGNLNVSTLLTTGTSQSTGTGFTVNGIMNIINPDSNSGGKILMKDKAANENITIDTNATGATNDATSKKIFLAGDGTAKFTNTVKVNQLNISVADGTIPIIMSSKTMVSNLNAEYLGGTRYDQYGLKISNTDNFGYGIVSGVNAVAQATPTMAINVTAGTVYLADGTRSVFTGSENITLAVNNSSSPRIDIVYINNLGNLAVSQGTAAANPVEPSIPSDGIKVARINLQANASTITDGTNSTNDMIDDIRQWRPVYYNGTTFNFLKTVDAYSLKENGTALTSKYAQLGTANSFSGNQNVSGRLAITSSGTISGSATSANYYVKVTDGSDTLAIDPNEIVSTSDLYLKGSNVHLQGTLIESQGKIKSSNNATTVTIPAGQTSATWTHNYGSTSYAVNLTSNSFERHIRWNPTGKLANTLLIEIDVASTQDILVDCILIGY